MSSSLSFASVPQPPPKQHSLLFHPHMCWIDFFLSLLFPLMLPLTKMLQHQPTSTDAVESALQFRQTLQKLNDRVLKSSLTRWVKALGCSGICHYKTTLPINSNILRDWSILKDRDEDILPPSSASTSKEVNLYLQFPSSLLEDDSLKNIFQSQINEDPLAISLDSSLSFSEILSKFPKRTPFIVHFHGGGMVVGGVRDSASLDLMAEMTEAQRKQSDLR